MRTRKDTHTHTHTQLICARVYVCVCGKLYSQIYSCWYISHCVFFLFYFDIIARTQMSSSSWPPPRCLLVRLLSEASVRL